MTANHTLEQLKAGELAGIRRLKLACGLTTFPPEIYDLAESLEILDLSGNSLTSLPDDLPRLHRLRIVFCSDNQFTVLPPVLGACPELTMIGFKANRIREVPAASLPPKLRWLVLTDNDIETLPDKLGDCGELQKLMLAGNRLTALPPSLAHCAKLELLRIAANRLTQLPAWLLSLPRLTWLAYAGNPFCERRELAVLEETPVAAIGWHELQVGPLLGEGASGLIYQAQYQGQPLAVKLFKGAMTSDGLPRSEMAACIGAGAHAALIPIMGLLTDHPAKTSGLLMPLIDPAFRNLAGPPSLESCTRDVYAPGLVFSYADMLAISVAIATAVSHLHERGILHGDLYGHNIMYAADGACLLGDFGAASLFEPGSVTAVALQQFEVRAFGFLLEELIALCPLTPAAQAGLVRLGALSASCTDADNRQRPGFAQIMAVLTSLQS